MAKNDDENSEISTEVPGIRFRAVTDDLRIASDDEPKNQHDDSELRELERLYAQAGLPHRECTPAPMAERIRSHAFEKEIANRKRQKVGPLSDEGLRRRDGTWESMKRTVFGWRQHVAVFSGAFAAGALVMRFAFMPAAEMTRTAGQIIEVDGRSAQRVEIFVDVPSALITEVVDALGKTEIKFELSADQDRFSLLVYDLVPNDPEQQEFKGILKINKSASGPVLFEVQERLHD